MNYKLGRMCPFYDEATPQWSWCGRPCTCRAFILDPASREHAIYGNVAKAPQYAHDIMPGDREPDFQPFPGYGVFKQPPWANEPGHKEKQAKAEAARNEGRVEPDPVQMAKARQIAAKLPNTGFGVKALTHQPKPRPKPPEDAPDAPEEANKPANTAAVSSAVSAPVSKAERRKAYQRELMRKRRAAKKDG